VSDSWVAHTWRKFAMCAYNSHTSRKARWLRHSELIPLLIDAALGRRELHFVQRRFIVQVIPDERGLDSRFCGRDENSRRQQVNQRRNSGDFATRSLRQCRPEVILVISVIVQLLFVAFGGMDCPSQFSDRRGIRQRP
jgi:hypothetical protein